MKKTPFKQEQKLLQMTSIKGLNKCIASAMVGKNGHLGKVIAGKFNHLEGNFDF